MATTGNGPLAGRAVARFFGVRFATVAFFDEAELFAVVGFFDGIGAALRLFFGRVGCVVIVRSLVPPRGRRSRPGAQPTAVPVGT